MFKITLFISLSKKSLLLLETGGEKEAVPEWHQTFEVAAAQTSGLVNIVSSCQTGFLKWDHLVIDKPMVITKLT